MSPLFTVGMCILMHGHAYKVIEVHSTQESSSYCLKQTVMIFEEPRSFTMYWKSKYIDKEATKCQGFCKLCLD